MEWLVVADAAHDGDGHLEGISALELEISEALNQAPSRLDVVPSAPVRRLRSFWSSWSLEDVGRAGAFQVERSVELRALLAA